MKGDENKVKVLILNSGMGKRMGALTTEQPKCMTTLMGAETILSRQLKMIMDAGISDVIMTTGFSNDILERYCQDMELPLNITFVENTAYKETNYIYSIYCAREYLEDDILLMHGDLVFEKSVLDAVVGSQQSCMTVSSTVPLPQKDFKAVLSDDGFVEKVGVSFFERAVAAQPLYKLLRKDWLVWLKAICQFCEAGKTDCYAENALNEVTERCRIFALDVQNLLCAEVDTQNDLSMMQKRIESEARKEVYLCFGTDIIHRGHTSIIDKAAGFGRVTIGVLSDECMATYKRFPLLSFEERKDVIAHIAGVESVVEQKELSYANNLRKLKPDIVVHGDDWKTGFQASVREEVLAVLQEYGGQLIEFPYRNDEAYAVLESAARKQLSIPDIRRGRLRKLLDMKPCINAIEAHSGITGIIAEQTKVLKDGKTYQFDAMWVSSLCDSTAKGKPDIELVDMSSRLRTIDDIMEVTTKPIILDGDTGGLIEHFVYNVKTLERLGVSAVIIEDKTGLKKNSLFGTEVAQTQDSIDNFCEKIAAGKKTQKTKEFMIIARIESLILERGMEDALTRAFAYRSAGADGIMIHSRKKEPDEIFEFVSKFRERDHTTPIVVVPTSFNTVTEAEFAARGVNIVIYANQLTRSGFPAMQKAALAILENHRAKEADDLCMSIKEILTLIPEE